MLCNLGIYLGPCSQKETFTLYFQRSFHEATDTRKNMVEEFFRITNPESYLGSRSLERDHHVAALTSDTWEMSTKA